MQGIGGFLCRRCVGGAIWEAMGRRPAGNVGRAMPGAMPGGIRAAKSGGAGGAMAAGCRGRCWGDGGRPGAAACGLGAWWGKLPADGRSMGAGVAEKGPGGLGDASIDYPLPFSAPLRTSRIWRTGKVHGAGIDWRGSGGWTRGRLDGVGKSVERRGRARGWTSCA